MIPKELGDVFWKNIKLFCFENSSCNKLILFLENRLAVYTGIKRLHIKLYMRWSDELELLAGGEGLLI